MRYFIILSLIFLSCCVNGQNTFFKKLVPHYAKAQFAGGIGFVSGGIGYQNKKNRLQADLMYGYVPKSKGGIGLHSLTTKFTWLPYSKQLSKNKSVNYLNLGILINYSLGRQYFSITNGNYPFHYYGFPTAWYAGIFAGGGCNYKRTGVYYEVGTSDRELVTFIRNTKAVSFFDIMHFGIGVRYSFLHSASKGQ